MTDENGNSKRDEQGNIVWENTEYDIRNRTYEQLPDELKDRFNEYQIEVAIYQNCDMTEISKMVRKYNNHVAMNQAQKAFTYVDAFAKEIRDIAESRFFLDIYTCSRNDRKNGTLERVIGDTVLLCSYPDQYKKDTKQGFKWLNENGTIYDFDCLSGLLTRLTESIEATAEIRALFNSKHTHIFITAFKAFTELGREDVEFGKFLGWFVDGGNLREIDGKSWETWNENKATRDTNIVRGKIDYLVTLFPKYYEEIKKAA